MKRILYVLALGVFGITTTEFGVIGILPQLAAAFGITVDKAGWLLSAFALVIAVSAPFMSLLFSKWDRRNAMMLALLIFTISNIISAFAPNFTVLLLARMLPAFMHPVFWSIGLATAAASVAPSDAPKAAGLVFGGFTIASVLGIPLATYMADVFGWQSSFVLAAVINLISFLGLYFLLPSMPADANQSGIGHQMRILKKPALWANLALACLLIAAMFASYGYLAAWLKEITHMTGSQISLMLVLFGITGVAGNWLAGKLLSRNRRTTTVAFIVLLGIVHVLIYYAGSWFIPMVIAIVLWGFIHTGGFLISNVNVTATAQEAPEFANSIFTSCGNLAVTIGSTAGGLVIARIGIQYIVWASIGLLLLSFPAWVVAAKLSKERQAVS